LITKFTQSKLHSINGGIDIPECVLLRSESVPWGRIC